MPWWSLPVGTSCMFRASFFGQLLGNHMGGSIHGGTPKLIVYSGKLPSINWMMTGGTPVTQETPIDNTGKNGQERRQTDKKAALGTLGWKCCLPSDFFLRNHRGLPPASRLGQEWEVPASAQLPVIRGAWWFTFQSLGNLGLFMFISLEQVPYGYYLILSDPFCIYFVVWCETIAHLPTLVNLKSGFCPWS